MRANILAMVGVLLVAGAAQAAFFENFDSYADQAALSASWTANTGSGLVLDSSKSQSAPNSAYTGTGNFPDPTQESSRKYLDSDSVALRDVDFSFDFEDPSLTNGRTYGILQSRAGTEWSGGLSQLVAIGKYSSLATTKYAARIAFGSLNWFALDAGPDRTTGWHTARIQGDGAATPTLTFSIDGIVGKQVQLTQVQGDVVFNWVVIGSGLTSNTGMNFDNIRVAPEPTSLLLLALGGLIIHRRRS